jgi:hypothetical protein
MAAMASSARSRSGVNSSVIAASSSFGCMDLIS